MRASSSVPRGLCAQHGGPHAQDPPQRQDPGHRPDIANPFFAQILQGAEDAAQAVGRGAAGDTQHQPDREERYAQMLRRNEADGMIVLGHRLPPTARDIVEQRGSAAPVVNGCEFDPALGIPSVTSTMPPPRARDGTPVDWDTNGSRWWEAPDNPLHQQRMEGSGRRAARGRLRQLNIMPGDFSVESGHAAAMSMLAVAPVPTAVFCFSDQMALGTRCLPGAGHPRAERTCPSSALTTWPPRYLTPPLTTIRQPMRQIGERAVNLLLAIIEQVDVPLQQTLEFSFMLRGSTAAPGAVNTAPQGAALIPD